MNIRSIFCCFTAVVALLFSAVLSAHAVTPSVTAEQKAGGMTASYGLSEAAVPPAEDVTLYIKLRLVAPKLVFAKERPPLSIALVIDRSGSMQSAGKLDFARQAGKDLVRLLRETDQLSIVQYGSSVEVLAPFAPVKNRARLNSVLDGIQSGGNTFLSGGLEKGIEQLLDGSVEGVKRVVLLSDGQANVGVTRAEDVASIGAEAMVKGISISSMGLGRDYDENLMQLLAQRGGGFYSYVRESADLPAFFREELALAAESATRNLSLHFVPAPEIEDIKVYGYTTKKEAKSLVVEMGDMYSGEERTVLVRVKLKPGKETSQSLGKVELTFAPTSQDASTVNLELPLSIEVVKDHESLVRQNKEAAHLTDPVREEAILLKAEEAHLAAMLEMEKGNVGAAREIIQHAQKESIAAAPKSTRIANKLEAMRSDEARLDQAQADSSLKKDMVKKSKSSLYQVSQGKTQNLLLQPGDKGARVERLQRVLKEKKYFTGDIDAQYTEDVKKAVAAFQKDKGLKPDGIAGQATLNALGM